MRTIVVYDSKFGNTKKIAEAIKSGIGESDVQIFHVNDLNLDLLKDIGLLIIGSPTHGGQATEAIKNLLNKVKEMGPKDLQTAVFDTGIPAEGQKWWMKIIVKIIQYAAPRMANNLMKAGIKVLGAETFFVSGNEGPIKEGEIERAIDWAKELFNKVSK